MLNYLNVAVVSNERAKVFDSPLKSRAYHVLKLYETKDNRLEVIVFGFVWVRHDENTKFKAYFTSEKAYPATQDCQPSLVCGVHFLKSMKIYKEVHQKFTGVEAKVWVDVGLSTYSVHAVTYFWCESLIILFYFHFYFSFVEYFCVFHFFNSRRIKI